MDHDDGNSNTSGNRPFEDVLQARASRRGVLAGSLAAAATGFFASSTAFAVSDTGKPAYRPRGKGGRINFTPLAVADGGGPEPAISSDYQFQILAPWGDPIEPGGPAFSYPPTAADQARQIGIGHDAMWFFPFTKKDRYGRKFPSNRHGMLALNHEFGGNRHVLGKALPESLEEVRVSQHAHVVSVIAIARWKDQWRTVRSSNSRRIHVDTPVSYSGPAADHPRLQTRNGNVPLGTLNNCGYGRTPWGTYLTCEENFNGYFGASNERETWTPTEEQTRYGFSANGFGYGWHLFDRRFDLSDSDYHNEENRFGWVVEIDPFDATQKPVKRTALGRMKHEGSEVVIGRGGRAVVYMGDDERFDYIYKFVSSDNWQTMVDRGESPLDHGTLYAAKFNDDGSGEWLPLTIDDPRLAARFSDQGEVLVFARIAADLVGATPMDRPEWTAIASNGDVYCTLTNNSRRDDTGIQIIAGREVDTSPNAANPLAPNADGHIIRWRDADDHVGTTFQWEIFLISQATHGTEDSFSDPDGIWVDADSRVFIQTDGGQQDGLNNQMLVADAYSGEIRRMFTGVPGCEITGVAVTPDRRTMFINVQHPGNGDPALTSFPMPFDGTTIPRDAVVVITRKNGGVIGS